MRKDPKCWSIEYQGQKKYKFLYFCKSHLRKNEQKPRHRQNYKEIEKKNTILA